MIVAVTWAEAFQNAVYEISSNPGMLGFILVILGLAGLIGVRVTLGKLEINFQSTEGIATSVLIIVIVTGIIMMIFMNTRGQEPGGQESREVNAPKTFMTK